MPGTRGRSWAVRGELSVNQEMIKDKTSQFHQPTWSSEAGNCLGQDQHRLDNNHRRHHHRWIWRVEDHREALLSVDQTWECIGCLFWKCAQQISQSARHRPRQTRIIYILIPNPCSHHHHIMFNHLNQAGPCPAWTPWTEWSSCSQSCGGGSQHRVHSSHPSNPVVQ